MTLKDRIEAELREVKKRNRVLLPEDVVEFARNPESALHSQFTWDDTEAAKKYRLEEARAVIRIHVVDLNTGELVPQYTHIRAEGPGYREMQEVLADPGLTQKLMQQALRDLRSMQMKYARLEALKPLWKSLDKIEEVSKTPAE